jgi:apolipoprotein N-acyltransferase
MTAKPNFFLLSLFSALLLSLAWYWKLSIAAFFGFVPLLMIEDWLSTSRSGRYRLKISAYTFLTFLTWNVLVTWWVVYASLGGAIMAFIGNALLMTTVFGIFSDVKMRIAKSWGIWLLIPFWLAFEYIHTLWDISWTWLSLGNLFAFNHNWVQWYEFTGVSGGSLWVLAVNILVFRALKFHSPLRFKSRALIRVAATILLPIIISYVILFARMQADSECKRPYVNTVVVQPNVDPYNTKFSLDFQTQFFNFLALIKGHITPETDYLVLPETFITEELDEAHINNAAEIQWFRDSLLAYFPKLKIVTGGNTYIIYKNEKEATATARKDERTGEYYDLFNSGFFIDRYGVQVYHKSKLVPGVELMPFPALLKPLEGLAIDMGGTMGSLGIQKERSVFVDSTKRTCIAPVICYESVYGDYVGDYVRKHANLIFIITNDGWWDDTPGYIQHLNFARLRAIEHRRQTARSANTGVSCFIDEFGNVSQATHWWETAVIEDKLYPNDQLTFFSRFGDLVSYAAVILSCLLIAFSFYLRFRKN